MADCMQSCSNEYVIIINASICRNDASILSDYGVIAKKSNSEKLTLKLKVNFIDDLADGRLPNAFGHPLNAHVSKYYGVITTTVKFPTFDLEMIGQWHRRFC